VAVDGLDQRALVVLVGLDALLGDVAEGAAFFQCGGPCFTELAFQKRSPTALALFSSFAARTAS
jgi:hypothetical protein